MILKKECYLFVLIVFWSCQSALKSVPDIIESMKVKRNRIEVRVNKSFAQKYLKKPHFFAEYNYDFDLSLLDNSIVSIPFVTSVIPIIWVSNTDYSIDSMDEDLYYALANIKNVFKLFYPSLSWSGNLVPKKLVKNSPVASSEKKIGIMFSGGLDSVSASFNHLGVKQTLITLHGLDVPLNQPVMWKNVQIKVKEYAKKYGKENAFISTSYPTFINQQYLATLTPEIPRWSAYTSQAMALTGLAAPIMVLKGLQHIYMPATYTVNHPYPYGTHPMIESKIKYAGIRATHELPLNRLEKIQHLSSIAKQRGIYKPYIRVCWKNDITGGNCCNCEKCLRTINGILAVEENPMDFGFFVTLDQIAMRTKTYLADCQKGVSAKNPTSFWKVTQNYIKEKLAHGGYKHQSSRARAYLKWFAYQDIPALANDQVYANEPRIIADKKEYFASLWVQAQKKMKDIL